MDFCSGANLKVKVSYFRYRNSQFKDKTVSRPFFLYNGNSIPGKTVFILRPGPEPRINITALCTINITTGSLYSTTGSLYSIAPHTPIPIFRYFIKGCNDKPKRETLFYSHYLGFTGELWGVKCEGTTKHWPCYSRTGLWFEDWEINRGARKHSADILFRPHTSLGSHYPSMYWRRRRLTYWDT